MPDILAALRTGEIGVPRTIDTFAIARSMPYSSPIPGFHSHSGLSLVPTESCHLCNELRRRQAYEAEVKAEAETADSGS